MSIFRSGWYLLYTKPRYEKKVHTHLTELKIDSFLPTRKILRTWHDRKKYVDEPLFPSYVFLYLTDIQNYYDGMDAEGALYYVRSGKEIAKVSDKIIDDIKLITNQVKEIEVSEFRFQPGRQLVIREGALTGLSCEVVECNNRQRLLVRIDLLQRNILLVLPEEHLMAI